ncbi:hypothetical protein SUGI_0271310 [Cryptomeria japonica]|nr:hypothetical protein SUGI_0271310 [Cryptomeria japonica]
MKVLYETGSKLSTQQQPRDVVLNILNELEGCLCLVEQSPLNSLQLALVPTVTFLGQRKWLKHSDDDIRVIVTSCLSEITRILAPQVPYDDNTMKEVLHLMVDSFQDLDNIRCPSFGKLKPYLLDEEPEEERGFKSEIVDDENPSHHEYACKEIDKTSAFNTHLEPSYEADNSSINDEHVDSIHDDAFQSAKDADLTSQELLEGQLKVSESWDSHEEDPATSKDYSSFYVGNVEINIDKYDKEMDCIHNAILPYKDYKMSSCKSLNIDKDNIPSNKQGSQFFLSDNSNHLNEYGHGSMALQRIETQCVVTNAIVIQALTRMDNTHKAIEDLIGKIQMNERQKGFLGRISHEQLQPLKEAMEIIKADYLCLLKDRDQAIKLIEEKDKEIDDLCLQVSLAYASSSKTNIQSSTMATPMEEENNARWIEITHIVQGMEEGHRNENGNVICRYEVEDITENTSNVTTSNDKGLRLEREGNKEDRLDEHSMEEPFETNEDFTYNQVENGKTVRKESAETMNSNQHIEATMRDELLMMLENEDQSDLHKLIGDNRYGIQETIQKMN